MTIDWTLGWGIWDLAGSMCHVFMQNSLLSQCISPPRSINGYWQIVREAWWNAEGVTLRLKGIPSREEQLYFWSLQAMETGISLSSLGLHTINCALNSKVWGLTTHRGLRIFSFSHTCDKTKTSFSIAELFWLPRIVTHSQSFNFFSLYLYFEWFGNCSGCNTNGWWWGRDFARSCWEVWGTTNQVTCKENFCWIWFSWQVFDFDINPLTPKSG